MEQSFGQLMAGPIGIIIAIVGIIWGVLMLFAPFFWYGTNRRTREISKKMDTLIEIQQRAHQSRKGY